MEITRIEIGSGKMPRKGFTHIDIEESAKPDILGDFRTMVFSNLEEIIALHVLEHFDRRQFRIVLEPARQVVPIRSKLAWPQRRNRQWRRLGRLQRPLHHRTMHAQIPADLALA